LKLEKVCVLDLDAKKELTSQDKNKFKYFVFGGILGDYPRKKRTKKELLSMIKYKFETRNLGKKQFSTDNAIYVANSILLGKKFSDLRFKNKIEIKINKIESIELPFCYPLVKNKPRISSELVDYLKKKKGF